MSPSVIHAITPGDHFSPRTGSAIPTVVNGLATAARIDPVEPHWTHSVVIDQATFHPRYPSADALEYTGAPYPTRPQRIMDAGLGRLGLPRLATTRSFAPIADRLSSVPASFVLAHNAPALPRLIARHTHDVVLYAHNDLLRTMSRREIRGALGSTAAIVCVSDDLATQMAERLPRELAARVHTVDNGVDTVFFTPRAAPASDRSRLRVMFVGRTIEQKGPDVLLRALPLLKQDDIEVVIVGSYGFDRDAPLSPYEEQLRRLANTTSIPVTFEPFVDRAALPDLLRTADIFVAPSRWREPSGLTIGEALATGLPVIASRVGGIPEVVGDAALLIEKDAPSALAEAIRYLVDDEATRERYAAAARRRSESRDWNHSWSQLRAVLETI